MKTTLLPRLHTFLMAARLKSFRAAARELGVSPAAVSQSVRQLEEQLRVVLFIRTTRTVALTEAGRRLLEGAGPGLGHRHGGLRRGRAPARGHRTRHGAGAPHGRFPVRGGRGPIVSRAPRHAPASRGSAPTRVLHVPDPFERGAVGTRQFLRPRSKGVPPRSRLASAAPLVCGNHPAGKSPSARNPAHHVPIGLVLGYSCLSASMGSSRAALRAGR